MEKKLVTIKIARNENSHGSKTNYQSYQIPLQEGMSVLDALDYIYENLDSTISYYSHTACKIGICSNCTVSVNGKVSLACQTKVDTDLVVEPVKNLKVVKDLVYLRKGESE
ncbi:MAG: 2Fe-2S iron-sulfur cluster-binding protein [Thermoplasmatales archaeon]|jgi:succinate dehydrogenase/fumarate reductase iron-sulfur protein|nr:2Fe-2S iron-sulfur cluster-binding protein [Candidatus Thermoplasmatota archaeon]MCL6003440.1 2Fe-2S iron-sulfur cluster-binding protein [Candidatus Thermoplasmatota archaeon]MDA8055795.1 2Fe-2S iron-sulfur cluster-binding protein [Thermoplasmatales archaeon]